MDGQAANARTEGEHGWRFAAALVLSMTSAAFVVPTVSVLAPELSRELGVTAGGVGGVLTVLYGVSAATSPTVGRVIGLVGSRRSSLLMFGLILAGSLVFAGAPSYRWLLAAAVVLGLGLTIANPLTNHLVAERAAPSSAGMLIGWKQAGGQFAWFVAGVSLPVLVAVGGWRTAALAGAALAVAGAVVTTRVVRPDTGVPASGQHATPGAHHASLTVLSAYALLMSAATSVLLSFLPLYLEHDVGYGSSAAGAVVAVMGLASVAGRVAWSSRVTAGAQLLGHLLILSVAAVLAVVVLAAGTVWSPAVWLAVLVMGTMATAWSAIVSLIIVQQFGVARAGRASGVVMAAIHVGLLASPVVVGQVIDRTGSYAAGWVISGVLFGSAALLAAAGRQGRAISGSTR